MALPNIKSVEIALLDQWFSNLVDNINYDLGKIELAVPALVNVLTTVDTAPIQQSKKSFDDLVDSINVGFKIIDDRLKNLELKLNQGGQ